MAPLLKKWWEWGNALVNGVPHLNTVYEDQGECAFRYTSRDLYMRKPASEGTNALGKKKQSYQTHCLLHLEERHKYCLPYNTEKCVMNVATVKPSLFLQLKQTECVISWLPLPNPKSQEGLNHRLPGFLQSYFSCFKSPPCLCAPNLSKQKRTVNTTLTCCS